MYVQSVKQLIFYTYKFDINSIPDMSMFDAYETSVVQLKEEDMPQIVLDIPAFFLATVTKEDANAWAYMDYIRSQKLDMVIFMFTEDADMAFMQLAIDHHVDELMCGRVEDNMIELYRKMEHCVEKINTMNKIRRDLLHLEELNFAKRQKVMEDLLTSALRVPQVVEAMLPQVNEMYKVNISPTNFIVLVISCNRYELLAENAEFVRRVTLLTLYNMRGSREIICNRRDPYGLVVVMNVSDQYSEFRLHSDLMLLYLAIKNLEKEYGDFDLSFGVGPMAERIHGIANSLTEASMAQEFRMFSEERILYAKDIAGVNRNWNQYISASNINELSRYVAMGDEAAVQDWFRIFYNEIEETLREYPPAYARLCWEAYLFCKELNTTNIEMFPEKKFFSLQNMFNGHERILKLESILLEICHIVKHGTESEQNIAVHAIAYMKVHFAEPLNLEIIAESCGVSPSYFSRKFKEETGEKYIDVLTDIRIQEAERLLEETDESVWDIMETVGYLDDKHFRRVFAKRTGMTPTQYRKKIKHF